MDRRLIFSRALVAAGLLSLSAAGTALAGAGHPLPAPLFHLPVQERHAMDHLAPAAPTGVAAGAILLVGLALLAGVGVQRLKGCASRRPTIACALALAVGVVTLETAVHSVHHLGDPEAGATCPILSGSQHLSWAEPPAPGVDAPPLSRAPASLVGLDDVPRWQIYRSHPGRSPPA